MILSAEIALARERENDLPQVKDWFGLIDESVLKYGFEPIYRSPTGRKTVYHHIEKKLALDVCFCGVSLRHIQSADIEGDELIDGYIRRNQKFLLEENRIKANLIITEILNRNI